MWMEVETAKSEGRRELVLTGEVISERVSKSDQGLDENIFGLTNLNFLEISKADIRELPNKVGQLVNLTNLVLHSNKLVEIPSTLGHLKKLKFLDISKNELKKLPVEIGALKELQTLNVNCNKLTEFVDVGQMINLHILDVSHNQLKQLPPGLACTELNLLLTVLANDNQIEQLPLELNELPSLKMLDVSNNMIEDVPLELSECGKLKDFKCSGNRLKDKRLSKMVDQCSTKAVLDYLKNLLEKEHKNSGKKGNSGDKKKKGGKNKDVAVEDVAQNLMKVLHFNSDDGMIVHAMVPVQSVRPFIVCCIVRNVNFSKSKSMMKRFILLQTKLHDGICAKRQGATIATHDLELVKKPITYDARRPEDILIQPLMKKREVTAAVLVSRLRHEAEELRKEKKRNTVSGIHKYLDLLKDKSVYPCLVDSSNTVISFPPITNSHVTRISQNTRHILIEVTSSQNLDICKKVMDELLGSMLKMGIGQAEEPITSLQCDASGGATSVDPEDCTKDEDPEDEDAETLSSSSEQILILQQVKVIDNLGNLKVVYPSRVDLQSEAYKIIRDFD